VTILIAIVICFNQNELFNYSVTFEQLAVSLLSEYSGDLQQLVDQLCEVSGKLGFLSQ